MIDRAAALEIARKRAEQNNWPFSDPVDVTERRRWFSGKVFRYIINTNSDKRGTKARFVIDAHTGKVISEGYVPR